MASNSLLPESSFTIKHEQNLTFVSGNSTLTALIQFGKWNVTAPSSFIILLFLYFGTLVISQSHLVFGVSFGQVKFQLAASVCSHLFFLQKHFLDLPDPWPADATKQLVTFGIAKNIENCLFETCICNYFVNFSQYKLFPNDKWTCC